MTLEHAKTYSEKNLSLAYILSIDIPIKYLTTKFYVAMHLFRSQMTSKCGKNEEAAHEPLGECVTDVLTTF